ncbi:MAG TPA: CHAT domain-containing protein, partial [Phototrophicaceae bacterium]|nr:CHAT domain-containing protein [Phototrophicaceae bacterium]
MKKLRTTSDLMLQCHHQQLLSIILNSRAELHQSAMKPSNNPWIYVDISLSSVAGRYQIKVTDSQKQTVICENWLPTNYSSVEYLYTARLLETSRIQLDPENDPGQATRYQDIVRYGQKLYKDLFGSDDKFQKYLRKSPHLQTGLRLVLRLHSNAAELWNIPWEYMHDGHSFLVVDQNYTIVRSMLDIRLGETRNNRLPHPLRILVVTSDPIDTPRLNLDQEVGNILEALDTAQKKGLVVVDFVEECTLHNLDAMLEEQDYHIIHYNGHGASTPKGSCLVMEDEDGKALPIFIGDFLPRIRKLKNLRLVVLNGCQTGQVEESQATSGIATGMLQAVPAVVAMQFSIKDVSAQVFARVFYETVASGASLENAMYAARQAMQEKYPVFIDWGVPALYSHHPDIRLIDPKLQTSQLAPLEAPLQIDGLPLPRVFVGRREEQRRLRRVLPAL